MPSPACWLPLLLLGCSTTPQSLQALPATTPLETGSPPVTIQPLPAPAGSLDVGPEILLPSSGDGDAEVARIGELVLRQSDAFRRLLLADPKLALSAIDLLVFDVLVARHAEQHGIRLDGQRIADLAAEDEAELRLQVQSEFGAEYPFAAYVWRIFGMSLPDWQQTLQLRTARRLYQGYVLRYLAFREDRVAVRYLVHKDEKIVAEVVDKVRAGADFATLALRWSEDAHRRDGGLLPPFARDFPHPVTATAFTLQRGEVAGPIAATIGDEQRFLAVYCLERLSGRPLPFAELQQEIELDLQQRPLSPLETQAYTMRWRGQLEEDAGR